MKPFVIFVRRLVRTMYGPNVTRVQAPGIY